MRGIGPREKESAIRNIIKSSFATKIWKEKKDPGDR